MTFSKKLCLAFACFALLWGNIASASMGCCMSMSKHDMQMDNAMPCHDMTNAKADNDCNNCDCQHCLKMSVLPLQLITPSYSAFYVTPYAAKQDYLYQPEGIFQPPKQLS